MELSDTLLRQFAQVINEPVAQANPNGVQVEGTAKLYNNTIYVQLDGSDQLTPVVSSTAGMKDGDRVTVLIKDHTAKVTGNVSSPSASQGDVEDVKQEVADTIAEFEIVIADKVSTEDFDAEKGRIDALTSDTANIKERLTATEADIGSLEADNVKINQTLEAQSASIDDLEATKIDASIVTSTYATIENLNATNANLYNLQSEYAEFEVTTTNTLEAHTASINTLDTTKLSAEQANLLYAQIDFSNIGEAAVEELFAKSGIIEDLIVSEGHITGQLVGVTISGNLIEGNTIKADKLVVLGDDGLYYKLNVNGESVAAEQTQYNSLNGSVITANTITAEKINVDDLVAFNATIGGFKITSDSLYSGVKSTIDNTTRGTYMNDDGEFAIGDQTNYIKFFHDTEDDIWKLTVSANAIKLAASGKDLDTVIDDMQEQIDSGNIEFTKIVEGEVITIDGNAERKPVSLTVYGNTVENLWVNPEGTTAGVTITENTDGTMVISGMSTDDIDISVSINTLKPSTAYTASINSLISSSATSSMGCVAVQFFKDSQRVAVTNFGYSGKQTATFTSPESFDYATCTFQTGEVGNAFSLTDLKVMLVEGETAEKWCPSGVNSIEDLSICIGSAEATATPLEVDLGDNVLRSLSDGTRDELNIDEYGNMVVTKRVSDDGETALDPEQTIVIGQINLPELPEDGAAVYADATVSAEVKMEYWTLVGDKLAEATEDANNALDSANDAVSVAEDASSSVQSIQASIELINASIEQLVTDENGTSLMTQTSNGWTFNIGGLQNSVEEAATDINEVKGEIGELNNLAQQTSNLANDLAEKTAYINMTQDETGAPSLELGKQDNPFKVRITNTGIDFIQGTEKIAYITNRQLYIQSSVVTDEMKIGATSGFIWKKRGNGNMGLRWVSG